QESTEAAAPPGGDPQALAEGQGVRPDPGAARTLLRRLAGQGRDRSGQGQARMEQASGPARGAGQARGRTRDEGQAVPLRPAEQVERVRSWSQGFESRRHHRDDRRGGRANRSYEAGIRLARPALTEYAGVPVQPRNPHTRRTEQGRFGKRIWG